MKGLTDKRSGLAKRLGGVVPTRTVDGYGARLNGLTLRALRVDSLQKATAQAMAYLTSEEVGFTDEQLYTEVGDQALDLETKCQVLFRALVEPDDPAVAYAASVDEVRAFEPDEITVLFNEFVSFQEERSPLSRAQSWEEVEGFIESLGKGSVPATRLNSYDASSLRFMLHALAVRHWTLMRQLSSDTSRGEGSAATSSSSSDAPSTETRTTG